MEEEGEAVFVTRHLGNVLTMGVLYDIMTTDLKTKLIKSLLLERVCGV